MRISWKVVEEISKRSLPARLKWGRRISLVAYLLDGVCLANNAEQMLAA